jgi:hypothetical protein
MVLNECHFAKDSLSVIIQDSGLGLTLGGPSEHQNMPQNFKSVSTPGLLHIGMILLPGQFKLYLRDWKHLNKACCGSSYFFL